MSITLSLVKLENLLGKDGYIPNKYYTNKDMCMYIEVISLTTGDLFLLYIPSNYDIKVENRVNIFKIDYLNIDKFQYDNIADNYGEEIENMDLEKTYKELDIEEELGDENLNLEKKLEKKYQKNITLKDITNEDVKNLKSIYRQLTRLKNCVKDINYKISILYKSYIFVIRRDNTIDVLSIENFNIQTDIKKLFIIIDLEMFYKKKINFLSDINNLKLGINNVLKKIKKKHNNIMKLLLEEKDTFLNFLIKKNKEQDIYKNNITELKSMLITIISSEKNILEKINKETLNNNNQYSSRNNDFKNSMSIYRLNKELDRVQNLKKNIIELIIIINEKDENNILSIDNTLFDNCIMINTIIKNFKQ